jgi:hypothetical protein
MQIVAPIPRFIVMTSSAHMPSRCKFGNYGNVAVVETDGQHMPRQIHIRHASVLSIPYYRGRLNCGKTERCAFQRCLAEAQQIAARMNAECAPVVPFVNISREN